MSQAMSFQITCDDCGRARPIVPANAGETISCPCGKQLKVPKLSELRRIAGQQVEPIIGIADELRTMYLEKQLPTDTHCMFCQMKTADTLECWVECERAQVDGEGTWGVVHRTLLLFHSPLRSLLHFAASANETGEVHGNDLVVRTPLPICENCLHKTSRTEASIRTFLRSVPLYRQLLDTYPGARVGVS